MVTTLRRPGPLIVIPMCTFIVAACAYVVASAQQTTYSAEALGVINPSPQLTPDQANRLAVTYALLIPKDAAIVRHVAASLGRPASEVGRSITVSNDRDTSVLRIGYRAPTAGNARAGALAVLLSLTGGHPASANIAPRSVGVVLPPKRASASKSVTGTVAVSTLLGIALGALLMLALKRSDPRVDDVDDVAAHTDCPVSSFDVLSDTGARAILERWKALAGMARVDVALLPVSEGVKPDLGRIAVRFAHAEEVEASFELVEDVRCVVRTFKRTASESVLIPGGVPGGDSGGEALAMACDVTVLVVQRGARRSEVRGAVDVLREFGVAPVWAILIQGRADGALEETSHGRRPNLPARQLA
jgi:hypothetical protein